MRTIALMLSCSLPGLAADMAAGWTHSAFVVDGTVWTSGDNTYGQLGQPDAGRSLRPRPVRGLRDVVALDASWHTLAVTSDGQVYTWGRNTYGQLGNGKYGLEAKEVSPVRVEGLKGILTVAAGFDHSLALSRDGVVYAWGSRSHGQVGDGVRVTGEPVSVPVRVAGLPKIRAIAGGGFHSLALTEDGTVYAWGSNWNGQLGNGKIGRETHSAVPKPVLAPDGKSSLNGVQAIAAGGLHSIAVTQDGQVLAWGYNGSGQVPSSGRGSFWSHGKDRNIPVPAPAHWGQGKGELRRAVAAAAGYESTYALTFEGTVVSAGWGVYGELGSGAYGDGNRDRLYPVTGGKTVLWETPKPGRWRASLIYRYTDPQHIADGVKDLDITDDFSGPALEVGEHADGEFVSAGVRRRDNSVEALSTLIYPRRTVTGKPVSCTVTQLRFGTGGEDSDFATDVRLRWTEVSTGETVDFLLGSGEFAAGEGLPSLGNIVSIASGMHHAIARDEDGSFWVWGHNGFGQLGTGDVSDCPIAKKLPPFDAAYGPLPPNRHAQEPAITKALSQDAMNVREHGAVGDGITLDQHALQNVIDACGKQGGGTVLFPPGTYRTGCLELHSGVRINLSTGATILASGNREHFPHSALVRAEDAKDISIVGGGVIDGQGHTVGARGWRHSCIYMEDCRNVLVEGISTVNSGAWTVHYARCKGLTIRNVTIRSVRPGRNNDGLDMSGCEDVTVEGCTVISDDDAIVIKSQSPEKENRHILVVGNTCHTYRGAFKLGTETRGVYQDITCRDLVCYGAKALELYSVDGSPISGITIENVRAYDALVALNIRLGARLRPHYWEKGLEPKVGNLRDIQVRNVEVDVKHRAWRDILLEHCIPGAEWAAGHVENSYDSCISGLPGHPVENVRIDGLTVRVPGGKKTVPVAEDLPERPEAYPHAGNFGVLPAYGLFVRHANGIHLKNAVFTTREPDARPPVADLDTQDLTVTEE